MKPLAPTPEDIRLLSDPKFLEAIRKEGGRLISERLIVLYEPYEKQRVFHDLGKDHRERLLMAGNQLGKALRFDEPVLTPAGWVPIGQLKAGDLVIAGDGFPTEVTGVFPQGVRRLVEVTFDYGQKVVCDLDHLWKVLPPRHRWTTRCERLPCDPVTGRRASREVQYERFGRWEICKTANMNAKQGLALFPQNRFATPHVGRDQYKPQLVPEDR